MTRRSHPPVVVVGAGIAGMSVALSLAPHPVILLCGEAPGAGGATPLAAGGIAAALGPGDDPRHHAEDTMRAGHCNDADAVATLVGSAADAIAWLEATGVAFDRAGDALDAGLEGGHGRPRILHAGGDATGAAIACALARAVAATPSIETWTGMDIHGLRIDATGRVVGVLAGDRDGHPHIIDGQAVVLACGGIGGLFEDRTGPGDLQGLAISAGSSVGARLRDLPFIQFHPTALAVPSTRTQGRRTLITEALRGAGAVLRDAHGRRLMAGHPLADLAPRDVVARAVVAADRPWLDTSPCSKAWPELFPATTASLRRHGLEPGMPIPVCTAQHFHMGGLATDLAGAASVPGLHAVGECACNGVHGANRLASNSLLEGVVFGRFTARAIAAAPARRVGTPATRALPANADPQALARIRATLARSMGPQRDRDMLARARLALRGNSRQDIVARALVDAALALPASVGAHHWRTAAAGVDQQLAAGA